MSLNRSSAKLRLFKIISNNGSHAHMLSKTRFLSRFDTKISYIVSNPCCFLQFLSICISVQDNSQHHLIGQTSSFSCRIIVKIRSNNVVMLKSFQINFAVDIQFSIHEELINNIVGSNLLFNFSFFNILRDLSYNTIQIIQGGGLNGLLKLLTL